MHTRWSTRNLRNEEGATLIFTVLALALVILPMTALAVGGTTLWGAHGDLQRAADLGALAGAADTPTVDNAAAAPYYPAAIDGRTIIKPLTTAVSGALSGTDWSARPCDVADAQFGAGRTTMLSQFRTAGDTSNCTATWKPESPFLETASACAANVLDISSCASDLNAELGVELPDVSAPAPVVTTINNVENRLASLYGNVANKVFTPRVESLLSTACTKTAVVGLATVCVQTLSQLLGPSGPNVPSQVGVNLNGLLPAITTPRVQVSLDGFHVQPTFSPFTFTASTSATARRTIKSVLVLPTVGIGGMAGATFDLLAAQTKSDLDNKFFGHAKDVLAMVPGTGWVIDPNEVTRAAQQGQQQLTSDVLPQIDNLTGLVLSKVQSSLNKVACTRAVLSRYCPDITGPSLTREQAQFAQDLSDATAPPPSGTAPSLDQSLENYAQSGEPLWVTAPQEARDMASIFGQSVWSVLTDPTVNPVLAPLLSPLMYVPALDMVPVTVGSVTLPGGHKVYVLRSYPTSTAGGGVVANTLATKGLYQARLVK